jgi:hypothetical protein
MLALSVRNPWAWMIIHADKDVENRDWPTKVRGRILIHAAKTMTGTQWNTAWRFAYDSDARQTAIKAGLTRQNIERGGIIGSVEIYACVTQSSSRWFIGKHGFLLRDPRPLPFTPWRGRLGFFDVPVQELPTETQEALLMITPGPSPALAAPG